MTPTDCNAGPSALAPPNRSDASKHRTGSQRAKMTSATAIRPWPLDSPSLHPPGQAVRPRPRGGVRGVVGETGQRHRRGEVDDLAAALALHDAQGGAETVEGLVEEVGGHRPPRLVGDLVDGAGDWRVARVVEEDVEPPEPVHDGADHAIGLAGHGEIAGHHQRVPSVSVAHVEGRLGARLRPSPLRKRRS